VSDALALIYTFNPLQMIQGVLELEEAFKPIYAPGSNCSIAGDE